MNAYPIRPMLVSDAAAVASVHMDSFKGFFLTFLGQPFLAALYEGIVRSPTGISFVAEKDGRAIGFVAGSTNSSALFRGLLKESFWRLGWASFPAFMRKPAILPRLLRALKRPAQKALIPDCATLMSLGVLPQEQGCGIGRRLVLAFLEEACRRGQKSVILDTDGENNDSVNCFYQKMGFSPLGTYTTPEGRQMNQYTIALDQPEVKEFNEFLSPLSW